MKSQKKSENTYTANSFRKKYLISIFISIGIFSNIKLYSLYNLFNSSLSFILPSISFKIFLLIHTDISKKTIHIDKYM